MLDRDTYDINEQEYVEQEESWEKQLQEIKQESLSSMYQDEDVQDYYFKQKEVGLKHPVTESVIKLTDDGFIDIFADDQLGIRIDPNTKSINILGENINLLAKNVNVRTNPNGFIWNGYYFNPQLYYEDEKERAQVLVGHKEYYHYTHEPEPKLQWHRDPWEIRPMIRSKTRFRYSQGVQKIMKELGLPTPDV